MCVRRRENIYIIQLSLEKMEFLLKTSKDLVSEVFLSTLVMTQTYFKFGPNYSMIENVKIDCMMIIWQHIYITYPYYD